MIRIRPAAPNDAAELPEIERSSGAIFQTVSGLEWIADDDVQSEDRHLELILRGFSLVAEQPGHGIIAFLNGERTSDGLHLWQIAVHQDYQRQGIGRRLFEEARRIAAQHGIRSLTLTTFRDVPWNQTYYRRLGFSTLQETSLTPHLRKVLADEARAGLPMDCRCAMLMKI